MSSALLAALISSVGTAVTNIALSERQRKFNEQYQDKMNEYNLPENQVQRLKDAGINPNSVAMGNGTVVTGNQSASINPYSTPYIADPFSLASNSFLSMSQGTTENQLRDVRKREADANIQTMMSSAKNLDVGSEYQSILNGYAAAMQEAAISEKQGRSAESWANVGVMRQQTRWYQQQIEQVVPEQLKNYLAERNVNILRLDEMLAAIDNYHADTNLKNQQASEVQAKAALETAQSEGQSIENANAQEIANHVIAHYKTMINKLSAETGKTQEETFWMLFDELDKNSISIMGSKIPFNRFGNRTVRHKMEQAVEERYRKMGPRVYNSVGQNYP